LFVGAASITKMDGTSVADLRNAFASAEVPTNESTGDCGLCECSLDADEAIVEVELAPDTEDPDSLLCSSCYEHVVGELGVTPRRVFKTGPRRRVVLPDTFEP
jgi:hypothetical protein